MQNIYDKRYSQNGYYWGKRPSAICYRILQIIPPEKTVRLLDIGCGEGRNAVFFARNGYEVTAFDLSPRGVEKTKHYADEVGVSIEVFQANLNEFRLKEKFDVIFSIGVLHYVPQESRKGMFDNYRTFTNDNGLNAFSVFVKKPFIPRAPDSEKTAHEWLSGELFGYYHDWKIEFCEEDIFDCDSSGVPHRHAINRMIAKKVDKF
jgi:tellurite methyltransferase